MAKRDTFLLNIGLALLVSTIVVILSERGSLTRPQFATRDFTLRLRSAQPCNPHIVIVEITDEDIAKVGRWPWNRSWLAAMTRALTEFKARIVYFDILLAEPSSEKEDGLFEEAIKLSRNVYLPFVFQAKGKGEKTKIPPLERFSASLKGTGALNIYPDMDGILRRIPLILSFEGAFYPHVSLKIASDYMGLQVKNLTKDYLTLADSKTEIKIPIVGGEELLVNWAGKWQKTFKHYDFLGVLAAYQDVLENKKPPIDISDFKDAVCLVGITGVGLYDIKPTPLEPEYPGIGVIANAISNILDRNFIREVPKWINFLVIYLLSLLPSGLVLGKKPVREAFFVALIGGIYFYINLLFLTNGVDIKLFAPLLGLFTASAVIAGNNFIAVSMEKQRFYKMAVTDALTGLFNIEYFKKLLEHEIEGARHDPHKKFSLIIGDIDHFKKINDTYGHQVGDAVLKQIAQILKHAVRSSDVVARYGGEEMIILLRGTSLKDALVIAEEIRKTMAESPATYKVTISLGVSTFKNSDTANLLIQRADTSLYKSKEAGRDRVATIDKE